MRYLLRMEQGRLVDEFASRQIKCLIYVAERRIRYAPSPALSRAPRSVSRGCRSFWARSIPDGKVSFQPQEETAMDVTTGAAVGGLIGLLLAALIGLIIGAIAKLLMPGPDPGGWVVTILLGIAGSWVGSFVLGLVGLAGLGSSIVGAVLGAMLLLFLYRVVKARK